MLERLWRKGNTWTLLVGMKIRIAFRENSMELDIHPILKMTGTALSGYADIILWSLYLFIHMCV